MTRKGEVIDALKEMSTHRKFAKLYANAYAEKGKAQTFLEYHREVDNVFALYTKAIQAIIKPRPRRSKKML